MKRRIVWRNDLNRIELRLKNYNQDLEKGNDSLAENIIFIFAKPGHVCDRKVPYTCNFCGQKIETSYYICKGMSGKYKYQCKNCSRLGINANDVCAPREL